MNPISLIIGNVCSILAMLSDSFASSRKTAKEVLLVQSLSQVIYCVGTAVLKGYSGAVQNVMSIVRNVIAIRGKSSRAVEWLLAVLGVVIGLAFNNLGFVGLLPIIANFEYTLAVFRFRDNEWALKLAFLFCAGCFVVFNGFIYNFVGVVSNSVVLVTTAVFLVKNRKNRKKGGSAENE